MVKCMLLSVFSPKLLFLSDELEGCEVKYEKVGCFRDVSYARALSEEIFNARHNIIWQVGKWRKFRKRQVLEYSSMCDNIKNKINVNKRNV